MRRFTVEQSRIWQDETLKAMSQAGALHTLCWFIQMIVDPPTKAQARQMTQQERIDHRYRTACWPGAWVPIVAMGSDPQRSRVDAELIAEALHPAPGLAAKFAPALGLVADLRTLKYYEYGDPWDCVCSQCGAVFASTVHDVDLCDDCARTAPIVKEVIESGL